MFYGFERVLQTKTKEIHRPTLQLVIKYVAVTFLTSVSNLKLAFVYSCCFVVVVFCFVFPFH